MYHINIQVSVVTGILLVYYLITVILIIYKLQECYGDVKSVLNFNGGNMKHKIHPEVLPSIKAEFDRLYAKHPGADGTKLWELAEDFVRDIAVADTYLLNFMMQELV